MKNSNLFFKKTSPVAYSPRGFILRSPSHTGEPTIHFGRWFGGEKFDLTKPLQFMGGRGMLTLTDICKATDDSLEPV